MATNAGWVFFSAQRDEENFVSTRIFFAAIPDRQTAIETACERFEIDLDDTDVVSIDDCNEKLKEQAQGVKPGQVELLTVVDPPDAGDTSA